MKYSIQLLMLALLIQVGRAEDTNLLADTDARIQRNRTAPITVGVVDSDGKPASNIKLSVRHIRHLFQFGAAYHMDFPLNDQPASEVEQKLRDGFLKIFNYSTVTFYWGPYEPTQGQPQESQRLETIRWMNDHGITVRGHPVFWNHPAIIPGWVSQQATNYDTLTQMMDRRLEGLAAKILPKMHDADIFNELVEWNRFTNVFGNLNEKGLSRCVVHYLQETKRLSPGTKTVVNDYVYDPRFAALLRSLIEAGAPIDIVGQQCHMHTGTWPAQRTWEVLNRLSELKRPVIFSELSVLSGPGRQIDWFNEEKNWTTDPEHEAIQAAYLEEFYKLVYSHPSSAGIVLWNFTDRHAWLGAPVGILRADGSPKPSFQKLDELINRKWRTNGEFTTDAQGTVAIPNAFEGHYEIIANGNRMEGDHLPDRPLQAKIILK